MVNDTRTKQPKMTSRNWESGVIIPVGIGTIDKAQHSNGNGQGLHLLPKHHAYIEPLHDDIGVLESRDSELEGVLSGGFSGALRERTIQQVGNGVERTRNLVQQERICADMQPNGGQMDARSGNLALPSLDEVFLGKIPVPIMHPTHKHIASGQRPWFFRNEGESAT